jgi:type IV fimbrial biogenesis protein FimT
LEFAEPKQLLGSAQGRNMLIVRRRQFGFNLIELMIGIVVLAVLLMLAMPMFREWMASTQIRNASDALLNGMQLARTEALRRNTNVEFRLGNNSDWEVWQAAPAIQIQVRGSQEGQTNAAVVTPTPGGSTKVTFSPLGGVVTNLDATATLQQIDITAAAGAPAAVRPLRVVVPASGGARMCDPGSDLKSTDTRRC